MGYLSGPSSLPDCVLYFEKNGLACIIKGLRDREQGIADSLATAEKVRAEMAQLKNENEALLAKAREERAQLLKEARETKDKIINEAKEQAKIEANKILRKHRRYQYTKNGCVDRCKKPGR